MIIDLQRGIAEAGRIRIGVQVPTSGGRARPEKLSTFRLTSADRRRAGGPADRRAVHGVGCGVNAYHVAALALYAVSAVVVIFVLVAIAGMVAPVLSAVGAVQP